MPLITRKVENRKDMKLSDRTENLESVAKAASMACYPDGHLEAVETRIVKEHFLSIYINDRLAANTVCTPSNLMEMVVGRLITEQMIHNIREIRQVYICESGNRARVFLKNPVSFSRELQTEPTCCTDNRTFLKNPESFSGEPQTEPTCSTDNRTFLKNPANAGLMPLKNANWKPEWIFRMTKAFSDDSSIHRITRGTHGCYLSVNGEIVFSCEDIGRHNTLDKAAGYAALHGFAPEQCMLFTTGRVATDMVRKVIAAGIPVLVSKAVPTDEAVKMARFYNLNLICKAWEDRFEVFSRNPVILNSDRRRI